MNPGGGDQRGVDGVVGVMVAEHDVGHVARAGTVRRERGEQRAGIGHHAGIDHDHPVTVQDQRDGAAHPVPAWLLAGVALMQHVDGGRARRRKRRCGHAARPYRQPPSDS